MRLKVTGVVAAGLLVGGGGAVLAQSGTAQNSRIAQDQGGLVVAPLEVDRAATAGATNSLTVENRSKEALSIEVKARPWTVSGAGDVAPNRRSTLGGVRVTDGTFTLAPGQARNVTVALGGVPSGGSLYGALEVVGLPADIAKRKGVITGYRLVGPLRYQPAAKRYALKAGTLKVSKGNVVLPVRSTGNTNADGERVRDVQERDRHASRVGPRADPAGQAVEHRAAVGEEAARGDLHGHRDGQAGHADHEGQEDAAREALTWISIARFANGVPQSSSEAGVATP